MNCTCGDKAGVRSGVRDAESRGQPKRAKVRLKRMAATSAGGPARKEVSRPRPLAASALAEFEDAGARERLRRPGS